MSMCTNYLSKRVILTLHDNYCFYWNNVFQEVLRSVCIHEFVCVCLFVPKHSMKINSESKICSLLPSFILRLHSSMFLDFQGSPVLGRWYLCVCFVWCTVCFSVQQFVSECSVNERPAQGSMRKASSLSECRLLRVRRSGRRRRSLGKRAESSGRRRVISDRRARIRPSWSCSTARMSEMPERSKEHRGCQCESLTDTTTTVLLH